MSNSNNKMNSYNIPLWYKANLSIEEAAAYSGIGMKKLYEMTERQDCPFVLWIGTRRMIKRKVFEEYINRQYSIQEKSQVCDEQIRIIGLSLAFGYALITEGKGGRTYAEIKEKTKGK